MTINPWNEWNKAIRAGSLLSETLTASQTVIGHRQRLIGEAVGDPLSAGTAELGRMMAEKGAAIAAVGDSLARDFSAMQADLNAQAVAISRMMMGHWPSPNAALAMVNRGQRIAGAALASSVRALTPVHKVATANARRLAKKR